jgi:hypothetical protein
MRWVSRYLLRRAVWAVAWSLVALTVTVAALQLMRVGHHLLAGRAGLAAGAALLGLALPTLILYVAPAAVLGGLLLAGQRLRVEGAWETLEAAGARPWQRAWPLLAVALGVALLVAALGHWAEPRALAASEPLLWRQGARAWLHRLSSGGWYEVGGAEDGAGGSLSLRATAITDRSADALTIHGLVLAGGEPPSVSVARRARLQLDRSDTLVLTLSEGEAALAVGGAPAWHWGFATARRRLELRRGVAKHLAWLLRGRAGGAAATQRAALCLLLGCYATWLSLRARRAAAPMAAALAVLAGAELGGLGVGLALVAATEALRHGARWRASRQGALASLPSTCS